MEKHATDASSLPRNLANILIVIALVYAFMAGFRTIYDIDLGWQLASGRWIVEHRHIPATDVFSYTAKGQKWIYPALSGTFFYLLYVAGGYAALTWLTAISSAVTIFLLTNQRTLSAALLAIVAIPVIALRLTVRADLFTTVLFAATLSLLWTYHRTGRSPLWLLPIFSLLWVNLHWGFVMASGLCLAYAFLESEGLLSSEKRKPSTERLKKAWPWLAATLLATLVNPWGPRIYAEVLGWSQDLGSATSALITEYAPLKFNASTLAGIWMWRDPDFSAIWWLLIAAAIATLIALAQRNFGPALLLAGASVPAIMRNRFQGLFACIVVVVGGSILSDAAQAFRETVPRQPKQHLYWRAIAVLVFAVGAALAGTRVYDLISDRFYLNKEMPEGFGAGLSWWYPQRAMQFIDRERPPSNIFTLWSLGGFLSWRLPDYPDFVDSRGKPFPSDVFDAAVDLPHDAPDSSAWSSAAEKWGIQTVVVEIGRYGGMADFPVFRNFCESENWRPVFLDEVSAIFVRNNSANQMLIARLPVDCQTVRFAPPQADLTSLKGRVDLFNFWANSADMYHEVGRSQEALDALDRAEQLFPTSGPLRLERGYVLASAGRLKEAEAEFRLAIDLRPDKNSWSALYKLLWSEGRQDEADRALRRQIDLSPDQE